MTARRAVADRLQRWGLSTAALTATMLFTGMAILLMATATRGLASVDTEAPAVEAWHLAVGGSPWLEEGEPRLPVQNVWLHEVPNGHVVADRMAGPVVICIPFYWVARWFGLAHFSMVPAGLAAGFTTAATTLLLYLALRRGMRESFALTSAVAFVLGTPTWAVSADAPWTHTVTQLGLAGTAFAASRSRWWQAGAWLGVAMFGRPHIALIAAVLGLGMGWSCRSIRPVIRVATFSSVAMVLLLLWNRWMFGVWSVVSAGYTGHVKVLAGSSGGAAENYLGFLFSLDRGFLVWSPIFVALVPLVLRQWRALDAWPKWLALGGVLYSAVQLRLDSFTGGAAFYGYRLALELATCLVPLYAFSARRLRASPALLSAGILALQVGAMAVGSAAEGLFVDPGHVWRDNALWLGFRSAPLVVSAAFGSAALVIWIVTCLLHLRTAASNVASAGYRQAQEASD